ncbi:N-acetyltransferase [Tsukamurella sp. 1534]|uniref:GNAT family N-acetyltransferase n=1 Tax=Tsukamurella sp. 1534 TaxID=1151061 RepID=UPI0002E31E2D|nr:GNAT family N-acetyltransferase [Tsukamurella sp. 1534]
MEKDGNDRRIDVVTTRTLWRSFDVLARAFADDPVIRWVQPARWGDRAVFAGVYLASHGAPGTGHLLSEGGIAVGAAYWDPPGYEPSPLRRVASLPVLLAGTTTGFARGATLAKALGERRPRVPHWYLSTLGAVATGRGIGSTLLEYGLRHVSAPAYLESSNPRNVPLYQRFGFEPLSPIRLPHGGPALIPMYRSER